MREVCRITEQFLEQMLSPATRACIVAPCLPRARGFALGYTLSPATGLHCRALLTQGSRIRPGLHAVARYAGLHCRALLTQGSRTRPGLHAVARYAGLHCRALLTQGSRIRPGLHAVARYGLALSRLAYPGLADSPWATRCRPLCGLRRLRGLLHVPPANPRLRGLAAGYMLPSLPSSRRQH
jgi:hypothetical protein